MRTRCPLCITASCPRCCFLSRDGGSGGRFASRYAPPLQEPDLKSARQGFALALTMVLGELPCVRGVAIMQIIEKNLEVTSSARGQEAREGFLGRLFAYGAMVRSRRLFRDVNGSDKELTKEVTEQLLTLAQKKSFLREPAICVLLELVDQLPLDSLENSICAAPTFIEWIKVGPESGGADVLFLAVKLWQKLPAAMSKACPLLPKSGNFFELFDADNISSILPYLEEASISHPRVHSVWPLLFQVLLPDNIDATLASLHVGDQKKKQKCRNSKENRVLDVSREALARFWRALVDEHLLISSHARKHLALNLLMLVLPRLPTSFIDIVLSNTFVRCMLDVLASKDSLLFNCVQLCVQELCKWGEKDDERIIGVVISLQQGSLGKFDAISKTHIVKSLISKITSQVDLVSLILRLENMFCKDISTHLKAEADSSGRSSDSEVVSLKVESGEDTAEGKENSISERNNANRFWILDLMCSLCKQAQFDFAKKVALQIEVGKFLFCQVISDSGDLGKVAPQKLHKVIKWSLQPASKLLKDRCISRLLSLLAENQQLLVAYKGNRKRFGGSEESSGEIEDMGLCLFEFYQELKKLLPVPVATTSTQNEAELVLKLTTAISEISSAVPTVDGERCEKLKAMRSLLVQMVLQSCLDPGWDIEIASELLICCRHAFGDLLRLNLGEIEENLSETPPVIEVIVDLVIYLLSKPSAPLRSAAEQVFKCFSGDVTLSSLRGMLQVIKKQPLTARHKVSNPLDEEDNDDDPLGLEEDESEDDDEKGSFLDMDKTEDSVEDFPLEEVSELGMRSQEVVDKSTNSYKKANFDADKNVHQKSLQDGMDPDDSDLSDFDDDAMFRIDSHLAQIFKQKKKGIVDGNVEMKDAETQLLHLKFRLLALLEFFLQKHSTSPLTLIIVPSLLQAFVIASTTGGTQLADRVASILHNKVFKAKHYVKGSDIEFDTVKDILDRTWKLASRSANKKVGSLAQACWIWNLKVIYGTFAPEADRDILEVVSAALEDYFNQKKSRLPTSFFVDTFMRHNGIGKLLIGRLMEKCITARSEFLQCEAMRLAAIVLGSKSRISREPAVVLDDGWRHLAEPLLPYLERIDNLMMTVFQKPFKKASRQTEAVQFCLVCCEALPLLYSQTLAELINVGPLLSAIKSFKAPDKGKLRSLVSKFQHCLEAGPLPSSCASKRGKAENANGYLGEYTQTKVLPASERPESLAKPKKKKKKLELNV
ncbi:hypothetical protein O6H91_05G113300 [Diphasiastrum complanatum]|uniref:Uncharacterized protein n=1 Tax=Diphasiastrum complanatum TaxID=34168 RepID=A0ACC2DS53_DIPCM|nr:hypothetical protein O6H91_05G113300 [Diphasiastrum complanatum]